MRISSVCLISVFLVVVVCATNGTAPKMSYEEARDVVLSMQSIPLELPPRKMDDILAQQQSILQLMEDPGLKNTKGVEAASYAHPIFWGPFVVIGASGVR